MQLRLAAWPWLTIVSGLLILLASLAHIPAGWDALNHFDPPKRLLWASLAVILAGAFRARKCRLEWLPLLLAFGLLAWMVSRTLLKPHPSAEIEVLFTWILPVLFFILATRLDNKHGVRVLGGFLVLVCLIQAALMVLQRYGLDPLFFDTTSVMEYKPGRMVGTIGYQNQAVDFLALSSVGILLVSRSWWLRILFMGGMLLVAGLTGNRGGILAITLALLVLLIFSMNQIDSWSRRRKGLVAGTVILGLCGLLALMALFSETGIRFREVARGFSDSPAVRSRVVMGRVGMSLLREKPWAGWGAGEYAFQYLDRLGMVLPEIKSHEALRGVVFAREAHNDPLQFAVEFGLVGILLVLGLLGSVIACLWQSRRTSRALGAGMGFVLTYMAVSSIFSFPWQTSMGGALAGFLLGGLWPSPPGLEPGISRHPAWAIVSKSILLILSLILLGFFSMDPFLNQAIPKTLAVGGPAKAEQLLPPYAYRYHALVGAAYASQADLDRAEVLLTHAELGYRDILLWNNLGHVQGKKENWKEAQVIYTKWEKCGLDHADALWNLSVAHEQMGQLNEAVEASLQRIALWGDPSPDEIKRLAVLQLQSGNPKAAADTIWRYWPQWIEADAKTVAEIENVGGTSLLILNEKQEAAKWFRAALKNNPALESAKRNLESLLVGY